MRAALHLLAWASWSILGNAAVVMLAVWPLLTLQRLPKPLDLRAWLATYSLGNSNLDVALLALAVTLLHVILVIAVTRRARRRLAALTGPPRGTRALAVLQNLATLGLLGKNVAVAMLADASVWPARRHGGAVVAGLAPLFASVAAATVLVCLQSLCLRRYTRALQRQDEASLRDEEKPLLDVLVGPSHSAADFSRAGPPEEPLPEASPATIRELLKLALRDAHILFVAFTAGALAAWGQALIPYFTGKSIDAAAVVKDLDWPQFHHYVVCLVYTALGTAVFTGIRGGLFTVAGARVNLRLRNKLLESLLAQDISFFDTTKTGDVMSRLSADTTTVADQISLNINVFSRCIMQAALVLIFMFSASWRLTVVSFVLIPVNIHVCNTYGTYYKALVKNMQTALAEANVVAEEALSSMATVRAHASERGMAASYADKLAEYFRLTLRAALAYSLYMVINTFLPNAVTAIALLYGGHLIVVGEISAGGLIAFMLYQQSLASAFMTMGDVFTALTAAVGAADKVMAIIARAPRDPPSGSFTCPPGAFAGKLELRAVRFEYPARPQVSVLQGVDMVVEPGEVVALVGPSGSGKSSIVKLLLRFYLPSAGAVLVDGRDVGGYDAKWLRRHVAIVGQEPVLYGRSIARNIAFGLEVQDGYSEAEVPTREEIIEAAQRANAHDFICELPDGYETQCGDKGTSLSGGQKQRIAIARALVRRPAVLLLDEATSALDAESEAVVQEALERVMHGRTVLVIAHRLSTVQSANRIVVMQKGSIVESGTQAELQARNGVYAGLVRRQMRPSTGFLPGISPNPSQLSLAEMES